MTIFAAVLGFNIVYWTFIGLRSSKTHGGIWVADEVLFRYWPSCSRTFDRREDMSMSWLPMPLVRRMLDDPEVRAHIAIKQVPGVGGLAVVYGLGLDHQFEHFRQVFRMVVDAANEMGRQVSEVMNNLMAFCKRVGLLDDKKEDGS